MLQLRLVLSVFIASLFVVGIFIYSLNMNSSREHSNGKLIYQESDGWYGLYVKRVLGKEPEQDEWRLATNYGEIQLKDKQKNNEIKSKAWQFREAVSDANFSQTTLYMVIAILLVFLAVIYINRKFIEKKNPLLVKILLFIAPIYLLATLVGSLDDAGKAKEKAEKIFLEIEK